MSSALPLARLMRRQDKDLSTVTLLSLNPCQASAELTWACCSPKGRGFSRAVTIRGSGHCAARLPSPGVAANRISLSCATLRTLDCGTRSITGHASLPSMIRSAEPGYAALRRRGHSHGRALRGVADRLLALACVLLRRQTLFDPHLRQTEGDRVLCDAQAV